MAAGSLSYDFSMFNNKRKRLYDDDEFMNDYEQSALKRRNLTQLPIRSPPKPIIAVTPGFGSYGLLPGTLTPDSIPEDDEYDPPRQTTQRQHSDSTGSCNGSLYIHIEGGRENSSSGDMDTEMEISPPKQSQKPLTPLRVGRARSNDLMTPLRSPVTLNAMSPSRSFGHDRIPTPVASSFPARSPFDSSFASAAARHLRPPLPSTSLSPMIDAESWTPRVQRPPSPDSDLDATIGEDSAMAGVEDSNTMSSSFGGLSVHSRDPPDIHSSPTRNWSSHDLISPRARGLGLDGAGHVMRPDELRMSTIHDSQRSTAQHGRNQSGGRTGRLHMGYRADCEKCVARVPGHYSHIIWS